MASITTWARLEPHSRTTGMEAGLEMRVHDPLWMLARQWQFGEFQGEDTGSPVWTRVSGGTSPIATYLAGSVDGHRSEHVQDYSPDTPLEYLVEAERLPATEVMAANRRLAVEAGQYFLRLLGSSLADTQRAVLLKGYAIEPLTDAARVETDPDSVSFMDLVARRAIDGAKLLLAIRDLSPDEAAKALELDPADTAADAIKQWTAWCERMVGRVASKTEERSAWNPERMEYACAVAAPDGTANGQTVLVAPEYPGGHLDWFSFDVMSGAQLERSPTARRSKFAAATLPTRLALRGMPSNRLWEFEDAEVRFGSIEAGPTDLARLLLVGFLLEYDNDFFSIPLDADAGTLVTIDGVTITNTFGDEIPAQPFAEKEWRLFTLSTDAAGGSMPSTLFLPTVVGQHLAGAPIEQVDLVRDEMANIAWAIEGTVQSASGRALSRHEADQARRQRETGDRRAEEGTLAYQLDTWSSTRPEFWIPLVPEQVTPTDAVTRLACYDPQGDSRGQLLSERRGGAWLYVYANEIPRSGVRVTRARQYTRWYDGGIFSWVGREKRPGRGGASSGLRYDVVTIVPQSD